DLHWRRQCTGDDSQGRTAAGGRQGFLAGKSWTSLTPAEQNEFCDVTGIRPRNPKGNSYTSRCPCNSRCKDTSDGQIRSDALLGERAGLAEPSGGSVDADHVAVWRRRLSRRVGGDDRRPTKRAHGFRETPGSSP